MVNETAIKNLVALADAYVRATGLQLSTVSRKFYGKHSFFGALRAGKGSITTANLDKVVQRFADEWPVGAKWPAMLPLTMSRPPRADGRSSTG